VPIPTFPVMTASPPTGVFVPNPTFPVNVLMPVPLCVYPPDVVMPVVAAIAPAAFTWNCEVEPTANVAVGDQVPMPTLPFMTANPPTGVVVPMPTLPVELTFKKSPAPVTVDDNFNKGCAAFLTISKVAALGVVVPIPTLSVVVDV